MEFRPLDGVDGYIPTTTSRTDHAWSKLYAMTMLCASAFSMVGCGSPDSGARNTRSGAKSTDKGVLNLYIWADYLAPDTVAAFEKQTGVKVRFPFSKPTRRWKLGC